MLRGLPVQTDQVVGCRVEDPNSLHYMYESLSRTPEELVVRVLPSSLDHLQRIPSQVSLLYPCCTSNCLFRVVMHVIYVSACHLVPFFRDHRHNGSRVSVGDSWQRARPGKMHSTVADSKRRPDRGKATFACGTQIPVRSIKHTQGFSIVAKR